MTSRSVIAVADLSHAQSSRWSTSHLVHILQICTSRNSLGPVLAAMVKNNVYQDSFFANQYIAACAKVDSMDYASEVFNQMLHPNSFVYNALIWGFSLCSSPQEALRAYVGMFGRQVSPTSYTFSSLIKVCAQARSVGFGEAVHAEVRKLGFGSHLFVQTALVDFYADGGAPAESRKVFDEMADRDAFSWTTMISVHARFGDMDSARRLFKEMPSRNTASWNALISGYTRVGDVDAAAALFAEMPEKNLVSWTSMVSCYSQNGRYEEAMDTFVEMRNSGVVPDEVTLASVISACAHLGVLHIGEEIHHFVLQNRLALGVHIGSGLIDMYAKCGSLTRSLVIFFKLKSRNLFCWNALIGALASHGHGTEALSMFLLMETGEEAEPNWLTFVSVLSACAHSGLVKEGRRIFSTMICDYGITPQNEHYGCMVDLLGRSGLLKEAYSLVQGMKQAPNAVIWGALLNGCRIHHNLGLGCVALQKLIELEPDAGGYPMAFLNLSAEAKQWDVVGQIRRLTEGSRRMQKNNAGCSWIELDGSVHEFKACDLARLKSNGVYSMLVELYSHLKLDCAFSSQLQNALSLDS